MTKKYYRVPVRMDEIFRLRFVEPSAADDYFRSILTTPRPEPPSPAILFEKDGAYPGEMFGIVHEEDGTLVHFFYFSTDKIILPLLRDFQVSAPIRVNLPAFQEFKAENSRLNALNINLPMFVGNAQTRVIAPPQRKQQATTNRTTDPVLAAVLLVLLSLLSHIVMRRHKTIRMPDLQEELLRFTAGIKNPRKRAKVERLAMSMPAKYFREFLRDPESTRRVVSFINEAAHDDRVAGQVNRFLETIQDASTRRALRRIIDETTTRATSATTNTPAMLAPPPTTTISKPGSSLRQFLRQNRQHITTPAGAVSPVFVSRLTSFLTDSGVQDPASVVRSLTARASRLARQDPTLTHRKATDALLHALTEQEERPRPRPTLSTFTISPARKPRRRLSSLSLQQKEENPVQKRQQQQQQRAEAAQLVRRTPGRGQSQLGAAVIDANIQRILHASKTYAKVAPTLYGVIRARRIRKVCVVDAPNLLARHSSNYAARQKASADLGFVDRVRRGLGLSGDDMVVVVSQMNRDEWRRDDPVYFGRIGPDDENAFLVRVGCFDDAEGVDCHRSTNTKRHNECDDFVRLDLMARLLLLFGKDDPPQLLHATNDKGRNWSILSDHARMSVDIEEKDRYPLRDDRSEEERQKQLFDSIRKNVEKGMTQEQIDNMKVLGEKFHESFDVTRGTTHDIHEVVMEEALAYVVESLKSGIHPSYLNDDEKAILAAGYGEKWWEKWGYTSDRLEEKK